MPCVQKQHSQMIRQRKHDDEKVKQKLGSSPSPKQGLVPPPPKDSSLASTAEADDTRSMHYVNNSRSKARFRQFGPPTGLLSCVFRLRLMRTFLILVVAGVSGFVVGRALHSGFVAGPSDGFEFDAHMTQADRELGDPRNENHAKVHVHQGGSHQQYASANQHDQRDTMREAPQKTQQHMEAPIQQPLLDKAHQPGAGQEDSPLSPEEERHFQKVYNEHAARRQMWQKAMAEKLALQNNAQQNAAKPPQVQQNIMQQQPRVVQQPVIPRQGAQAPGANTANQPSGQQYADGVLRVNQPMIQDAPSDAEIYPYHVIQTLTNTHKMPHLKTRFIECTKSILAKASINLHFFFVVDEPSKTFVLETLQDITNQHIAKSKFQFHFIEVDQLAQQLAPVVSMLQERVTGGHPYYQDAIFFLSVAIHRGILPSYVRRVVMLDTDLKFMADIRGLFDRFDLFTGDNIMGIAREMQPVYRHLLSLYRSQNQGTKVGGPPPDGLTGFNSGVVLLDLERMRRSAAYRSFVNAEKIHELTEKYHFKGHLGDQDFFTLISLEKPDLFHILPCSWNRQLCVWWRDKGYTDVFDQYFKCDVAINIYHGNCNTPIPF
ncbi:uncharacterized protein LOC110976527 [Acanthaster planci]|uniref:Uncharacterized protein LOC110976527 n=1 Tax=Acanthaster planci TaxID=133434 RepID=A0A8B7XXE6_ACAPL|nr:uncharacterized protein LOC110976527 [Acanthaster planci]